MLCYFLSVILKVLVELTYQQFAVLNFSSELPITWGEYFYMRERCEKVLYSG